MNIASVTLLIFACLMATHMAEEEEEEEECFLEEAETRLQLVFVVDGTGSFQKFRNDSFASVVEKVIKATEEKYPHSEYGITSFGDFPGGDHDSTLTDRSYNNNIDYCYYNHQNLTTNLDLIKKMAKTVPDLPFQGSLPESSLTGLLFAAADKTMGWLNGHTDPKGKTVQKVLVLLTDNYNSNSVKNQAGRHPAKGDGSDKCVDTLPPTFAVIEAALHKEMMSVIGLFTSNNVPYPNLENAYNGYFHHMQLVRFYPYPVDLNKLDDLANQIIKGIKQSVRCEWADPPAYNTLGY